MVVVRDESFCKFVGYCHTDKCDSVAVFVPWVSSGVGIVLALSGISSHV